MADTLSPFDTALSAATRFGVELVAWVAGPWAIADLTGTWWMAVLAVIVLVGVPAIFSTPGDKNQIIVATPGPLRVAIEVALLAVAIVSAWIVWPRWAAIAACVLGLAMLITGASRLRWLARGASL